MEHGQNNLTDIAVLDLSDFFAEMRRVREAYHEHGADHAYRRISPTLAGIIAETRTRPVVVGDGSWIQCVGVFDQRRVRIRGESFEAVHRAANTYTVHRLLGEAHALLCADITLESLH